MSIASVAIAQSRSGSVHNQMSRDAAGAFRNRVAGVRVDATGWNWSAQFGGLGYDGDLDLYTVNAMVGEAFGYLLGAELLLTGWPVPRRASPLPMLSRSGSRS